MKPIVFWRSTRRCLKDLSKETRREAGHQLRNVQHGDDPDDWWPMPSIGSGVREIRIHQPHEYRVIFLAQFPEAVYVLHVFGKKTRRTPLRDIQKARSAYAEINASRKNEKAAKTEI